MKKSIFWMLVALVGLFTSCTEDALVSNKDAVTTKITVGIPTSGIATRAGSTAFADPALKDMRVFLIVSSNGTIVSVLQPSSLWDFTTNPQVSFDVQLVPGKAYDISAWADFGAAYYDVETTVGESPVVKMHSTTVTGSNNKYDAYFQNKNVTITGNEDISLTLTRPFALVKVNTTDWNADAVKNANYRPTDYTTTFEAPTAINLISGETSTKDDVTFAGNVVAYDVDGNPKEITFDYVFANAVASVLPDFTVAYTQGTTPITSYKFQNIPVQRNYKTNITGAILTKKGHITVSIDPIWMGGHVCDIAGANEIIAANADADVIDVQFTTEPNDAGVPGTEAEGITSLAILTTPIKEDAVLNINVGSETKSLYVGDYNDAKDVTAGVSSSANEATVNINVPQGSSIGTLVINAPSKTVYVNGQLVSNTGVIDHIDAITSLHTLIVQKDQHIKKLTMRQGGLEIHGQVDEAEVVLAAGATVEVRDCENLPEELVYNVLKEYIAEGYTSAKNQDGTWNIFPKPEENVIALILRNGKYLPSTGSHAGLTGDFAYVLDYGDPCVQDNDYVYLMKSITDDKSNAQISMEGKHWTLDLNGNSLKGEYSDATFTWSSGASSAVLWAQAQVNSGTSKITFKDTKGNGSIENTATDVKKFCSAISINAQAGANELVFESGTYKSGLDAIYMEKGLVTINGGTFVGKNAIRASAYGESYNGFKCQVIINNGTFNGDVNFETKTSTPTYENQKCQAEINGGIVNGDLVVGKNVMLTISGGKFQTPKGSKYLVSGKYLVENSSYFEVKDEQPATYAASLNGNTFFINDANDAVENALSGDVIELKANATCARTLQEGEELTFIAEDGITYVAPVAAPGFELKTEEVEGGMKYYIPIVKPFKVVTSGGTYEYESLIEAFATATAGRINGTITLMKDYTVSEKPTVGNSCTFNMNGHTLTFTNNTYLFISNSSASQTVTIKDGVGTGKMVSTGNYLIQKANAIGLTIASGKFECPNGRVYDGSSNSGVVNFNGGTFTGSRFDFKYYDPTPNQHINNPITITVTTNNGISNYDAKYLASGLTGNISSDKKSLIVTKTE